MRVTTKTIKKLFKFGFLGILTFILTLGITALLKETGGLFYLWSYWIAFLFTTIINFFLNIKVTFQVKTKGGQRIPKYLAMIIIFLIVNPYLVKILTETLNLHYLLSVALVTAMVFLVKFLIYDNFVFNK